MHHGVKGQKHGVRRFQNPDGTWTELGKRLRRATEGSRDIVKKGISRFAIKRKPKKSAEERIAEIKAKKAELAEKEKQKAIVSGDVKAIKKHASEMSDQELRAAVDRAATMKRLSDLEKPKKSIVDTVADAINTGVKLGSAVTNAKRTIDSLTEAFKPEESEEEKNKKRAKAIADKTVDAIMKDKNLDSAERGKKAYEAYYETLDSASAYEKERAQKKAREAMRQKEMDDLKKRLEKEHQRTAEEKFDENLKKAAEKKKKPWRFVD